MSLDCSALHQMVPPSTRSSGDELTNGTFDSTDTTSSSIDSLIAPERDDLDFRIQQRLEASRQGMLQLEALRSKHRKLMKEMRIRLSHENSMERPRDDVSEKNKELSTANSQAEVKLNDLRCDSPVSCCVSHRSSVSMDSGCVSLSSDVSGHSPISSNTNRKCLLENQCKKCNQNATVAGAGTNENNQLVATAIESTTALHCHRKKCCTNWPRPKSMCFICPDQSNAAIVDSLSFSQITPPPIHRKFFTVERSGSAQSRRPYFAKSCADVHSPIILQKKPSSTCFPVIRPPVLNAKPIALSLSSKIPTSPYMRLRDPQKPLQNSRVMSHPDGQSIFRASRIFVDRSPRILQCRKQRLNTEWCDSDEESPRLLRAQPAVVLSRQQSCAHSNESSPCELRKVHPTESGNSQSNVTFLEYHQQLDGCESSQSSETIAPDRPRRRKMEKDWKESEDL